VSAAVAQQSARGINVWRECQTCLERFTGAMWAALAEAWCAHTDALAETSDERIAARCWLAHSLADRGDEAAAKRIATATHETMRLALGDEHPTTLKLALELAYVRLTHNTAESVADAERVFREILRAGAESADEETRVVCFAARFGISACCVRRRDHKKAVRELASVSAEERRICGSNGVTETLLTMARALGGRARNVRALQDTVRTKARTLGHEHPQTLGIRTVLADSMLAAGDHEAAERELRDVLCAYRRTLGDEHTETTSVLRMLVSLAHRKKGAG
jgi:hypothetical protein